MVLNIMCELVEIMWVGNIHSNELWYNLLFKEIIKLYYVDG